MAALAAVESVAKAVENATSAVEYAAARVAAAAAAADSVLEARRGKEDTKEETMCKTILQGMGPQLATIPALALDICAEIPKEKMFSVDGRIPLQRRLKMRSS